MESRILVDTQRSGLCKICAELHPVTSMCKYDRLQKVIYALRTQNDRGAAAFKEVHATAKYFQGIISQMTPRFETLDQAHETLLQVVSEHPDAKVLMDVFEARMFNGSSTIPTEESQQQQSGVQEQESANNHVRLEMEVVPPPVSGTQL